MCTGSGSGNFYGDESIVAWVLVSDSVLYNEYVDLLYDDHDTDQSYRGAADYVPLPASEVSLHRPDPSVGIICIESRPCHWHGSGQPARVAARGRVRAGTGSGRHSASTRPFGSQIPSRICYDNNSNDAKSRHRIPQNEGSETEGFKVSRS